MRYLKCKSCGGFYELQEGELPENFEVCQCGGELEFHDEGGPKGKRRKIHPLLMIMIIIVGGYFIFSILTGPLIGLMLYALMIVWPSYGSYIFILFFGIINAIIIGLLWFIFRKK